MFHNLKQALRDEMSRKPLWQQWFEERSGVEQDATYMSSASAAVLAQSPRGGQQLLWAIGLFFLVMFVWAAWAEVDEFTRGEGKVIPSGYVQVVQNLEGGIISELYVREGQRVVAQQALLRIDDTRFSSSLREADATKEQLMSKRARLQAEAEGRSFSGEQLSNIREAVLLPEVAFFESRQRELRNRNQLVVEQVTQKRQELSELMAKRDQLKRSYDFLQRELVMTKPLAANGAISEVELLRLERQVNDLLGDLQASELAIPRIESSLVEVKQKLRNAELVFQAQAREELSKVSSELSSLVETNDALADRVQRTLVRSPVEGTVKQLLVKTIGGVIQPGMDIVEIVPTGDKLLVEAKVRPSDIAFLHPEQRATVKFTAYDFSIHGGLAGKVVHISPDTIVDEKDESYYLVKVETEQNFLGSEEKPLPIIPGMTVSVDILTGKKSILDYLLKPILKSRQLALRER